MSSRSAQFACDHRDRLESEVAVGGLLLDVGGPTRETQVNTACWMPVTGPSPATYTATSAMLTRSE